MQHTSSGQSALIVDGLSLSITSEDLRKIFQPFGPIVWARIATDRSKKPLGFGYVVLEAEDAAKAIAALQGKTIAGRELNIAHTSIPPLPRLA